ncbi:hypothetical protein V8D89_012096 [Ganoderma adspersum]
MSFANLISTDYKSLTLVAIAFLVVSGIIKIVMEGCTRGLLLVEDRMPLRWGDCHRVRTAGTPELHTQLARTQAKSIASRAQLLGSNMAITAAVDGTSYRPAPSFFDVPSVSQPEHVLLLYTIQYAFD